MPSDIVEPLFLFGQLLSAIPKFSTQRNAETTPIIDAMATFNRQPCVAHTLQLSVKEAVKNQFVKSALKNVRDTCKFYRKSSTGAANLEKQQLEKGSIPVRLHMDVPTRWGSTLFMIKRFLRLREHVDKATTQLYSDKFKFSSLKPGIPLSPSKFTPYRHVLVFLIMRRRRLRFPVAKNYHLCILLMMC